ncbi:MAG TPA: LysM peptidoglycan-binding domain-containing protein, partial [Candidatus Levybacteria bacterium]|nr:LysM peptidoglycan-binding domain-containing protein [Candidatus Levybacteria bacterium]
VIVIFALIFAAIRVFTQDNTPNISDNGVNTESEESGQNVHVVQEGETLWSISEKVYNDGFGWSEIAEANNLTDPSNLEAGTRLTIPARAAVAPEATPAVEEEEVIATPTMSAVSPTVAQQEQVQQPTGEAITGAKYTVRAGDTLWDISVRTYGTGYRWSEIATANSLSNPNLIFSGNVLTLPAK